MTKICQFCLAKLWSTETSSLCCANGQVILPPLQPLPVELHQLFVGGSSEAKDFRQHIRGYNASFAFASLGVHEDVLPAGVYSFRINVVYKSALPTDGESYLPRDGDVKLQTQTKQNCLPREIAGLLLV